MNLIKYACVTTSEQIENTDNRRNHMNNFGTKKKHALKLPEIRIPSLRQALLIAAMAVTVILAVTALSLQAIQPS